MAIAAAVGQDPARETLQTVTVIDFAMYSRTVVLMYIHCVMIPCQVLCKCVCVSMCTLQLYINCRVHQYTALHHNTT